jgi:hypothetical protein
MSNTDFTAYDASGRVRAVIEAKRRMRTAGSWAADFRRNLLAQGVPSDVVFVLVTPDKLYSWAAGLSTDAKPSFEVATDSLFERYFRRVGATPDSIEPAAFELLVSWWLDDIARAMEPADAHDLAGSGLPEALKGARVVRQEAA